MDKITIYGEFAYFPNSIGFPFIKFNTCKDGWKETPQLKSFSRHALNTGKAPQQNPIIPIDFNGYFLISGNNFSKISSSI